MFPGIFVAGAAHLCVRRHQGMKLLLTMLLAIGALPSLVIAGNLATVQNEELARVLANFEMLAQAKDPESKGMYVRVLKLQDPGECDGSPETCPQSTIYIAVSEYGEFPAQKVYQLPKGHNWEFVGWVKLPATDSPTDYVQLTLKVQRPAKNRSKTWWDNEYYLLKLNYREGSWSKQ